MCKSGHLQPIRGLNFIMHSVRMVFKISIWKADLSYGDDTSSIHCKWKPGPYFSRKYVQTTIFKDLKHGYLFQCCPANYEVIAASQRSVYQISERFF